MLYWTIFVAVVLLLAYVSLSIFSLAPFAFLIGGAALGLGYLGFRHYRKQEFEKYRQRFAGSVFLYVIMFWTTVGLFTNQKEQREFWARYEPHVENGVPHGYTFYYLDYANSFELVDSPDINKYIQEKSPQKVKMGLQVVRDFGKLRSYSLMTVDSIPVGMSWTGGEPPWSAL